MQEKTICYSYLFRCRLLGTQVGFAILSLNMPLCILLSCDSALEQAVRFLPRQKKVFCIPYPYLRKNSLSAWEAAASAVHQGISQDHLHQFAVERQDKQYPGKRDGDRGQGNYIRIES